jgi:hypothetical protein
VPSRLGHNDLSERRRNQVNVALKEWAVVVEALAQGRQAFLLRKGGIAEGRNGFELRHREFLFFPTWEHQQRDLVKPAYSELFTSLEPSDPETIPFQYFAQVTDVLEAPKQVEQFAALAAFHIWAQPYIDLRYSYRPDLPSYIVLTRIHRLPTALALANDRRYRGCRSWVELLDDVSIEGAQPLASDAEFASRRSLLLDAIAAAKTADEKPRP